MKEVTRDFSDSAVVISSEDEQRKYQKLIGSLKVTKGHILWQFNVVTKELQEAKFKTVTVSFDGVKKNTVDVAKDCIYFQSLNRKNALRKLKLS